MINDIAQTCGASPALTIRPSEAAAWPALDGPHEVVGYTPHKVTIDVDGIECTYPREVLTVQIGGAA